MKHTFLFVLCCLALLTVALWITTDPASAHVLVNQPESDSVILARHIHDVKVEYAIEEFSDHSFNAHYDEKILDSILAENRISITDAQFVYAPDSVFKIAIVEGQSCGAYCNSFFETWFHFNDGSGLMISQTGFHAVKSIEKIDEKNYLVWEEEWGRSGSYGVNTVTVTMLSIREHEIVYYQFPKIPSQASDTTFNAQGSFRLYQLMDDSIELSVNFNADKKQLTYTYWHYDFTEDIQETRVYSGYFQFVNNQFIHKEETSQPYAE